MKQGVEFLHVREGCGSSFAVNDPFCGGAGAPDLGRGEVTRSILLSGAPAGDELLILLGKKRGANSLQFLLLGFLDVGEG